MGTDRERVIRALDWLAEQGMLEVEASGVRHCYRRLKSPDDPGALADQLHRYILKRETAEIDRLQQVLDLAGRDGCQTSALAAHFGEELGGPCGHCSWCRSGRTHIPRRKSADMNTDLREQVAQAVVAAKGVLDEPRSLTRLLCGVPSPRLGRAKLGKHPLAGALVRTPFRQVLEWVKANKVP